MRLLSRFLCLTFGCRVADWYTSPPRCEYCGAEYDEAGWVPRGWLRAKGRR